jgi:hypothetical protein
MEGSTEIMTYAELQAFLTANDATIDGGHQGAGKFRDLEVSVGRDYAFLLALKGALHEHKVSSNITNVTNPDHPDRGKLYLEIPSFWCE